MAETIYTALVNLFVGWTPFYLLLGVLVGLVVGILPALGTTAGMALLVPFVFFVLVTGFLAIQVKAARIHTSVELTPEYLRQGAETIRIAEIVRIYPEASGSEVEKWQSARAIGELTGVPRGRTGIGLKLSNARTAQAWARKHRQLRAALESLVDES